MWVCDGKGNLSWYGTLFCLGYLMRPDWKRLNAVKVAVVRLQWKVCTCCWIANESNGII